jgi:UDP-glucose 4-epimerase
MYGDLYGIDYKIFCFGNVYGPRDDPTNGRVTSVFIKKMLAGEKPSIFGTGENTRDYLYVKDLAKFLVNSLEKETESRLFHLANGEQTSVNDVVGVLRKILGHGDVKHVEGIRGEVKDIVLDTSLAKRELGWEPEYSFEQGLRETVAWFEKNKGI